MGARADDILTLHDLNVLATRQTDENLRYSELMHHVAGWLTLALTAAIGATTLLPSRADKLKWVGPLILFLGGVGLFVFADRDLYRLTDLRQLRDREVQLHKALAILLATLGALGLQRLRRPRAGKPRLATPSKVVAVMALIGGGLLFTHVHTVAPYANVAAGVYIAHVVMGLVALSVGAVRLAEDAAPRGRRVFKVLFVALLGVESMLLVTYNEGLPWYVGYGRYQRWGVAADGSRDERAPIAPYGPLRAQLDFDPRSGRLVVAIKDRFSEAPVAIPARQIDLRVSRGYEEVGIPLGADATGARFSGTAPSLEDAMAFSARAALPVGGVMTMGYFDPWVSPAVRPIPPNRVAWFQCPMHDGIVSEAAGACPLCGMPLVPFRRVPSTSLHADDFEMQLSTAPAGAVVARAPVGLRFTPLRRSGLVRGLMTVHEHPLHLIIVSADSRLLRPRPSDVAGRWLAGALVPVPAARPVLALRGDHPGRRARPGVPAAARRRRPGRRSRADDDRSPARAVAVAVEGGRRRSRPHGRATFSAADAGGRAGDAFSAPAPRGRRSGQRFSSRTWGRWPTASSSPRTRTLRCIATPSSSRRPRPPPAAARTFPSRPSSRDRGATSSGSSSDVAQRRTSSPMWSTSASRCSPRPSFASC